MALSSSSSSAMPTMFTIFAWKLNTNFMKVMIQLTCNQVGYGVLHGIWFWVEIASLQGIWKKNIKSIPVFELSCRQILDGKFKVMTSTPFLWEQLLTIDNCLRLDMRLQWNTCSVSHMLHGQFVLDYYRIWLVCLIWFCVYCLHSYNCFKELKYFLGPIGQ